MAQVVKSPAIQNAQEEGDDKCTTFSTSGLRIMPPLLCV